MKWVVVVLVLLSAAIASATCPPGGAAYLGYWDGNNTQENDDFLSLGTNCYTPDLSVAGRVRFNLPMEMNTTFTSSTNTITPAMIEIAPTYTIDALNNGLSHLHLGGSLINLQSPGFGYLVGIQNNPTIESDTVGVAVSSNYTILDQRTMKVGNVDITADNVPNSTAYKWVPTYLVSGASGKGTITPVSGFVSAPTLQTDNASGTLTVTDLIPIDIQNPTWTATGTNTLTHHWGVKIAGLTHGTNIHPLSFGEATITGTPASSFGDVGVDNATPSHLYFQNDSNMIWYAGMTSTYGACLTLGTTTATKYFPVNGNAACSTSTTSQRLAIPGPIHLQRMSCGVTAAPGSSQTRTFTVYDNGSATSATCTVPTAGTACQWCVASSGSICTTTSASSIAIATGRDWEFVQVASGTVAAADAGCTLWYTQDNL